MRNLVLLQDSIFSKLVEQNTEHVSDIVSICRDIGSASIFVLTNTGNLSRLDVSDCVRVEIKLSLCSSTGEEDSSWFDATVVGEIGAVVCISHSGMLVSVRENPETGRHSESFEQEGDVDGGIAAACWNPDASNLVIVTNNDSMLLMTPYWDVLEEVTLPSRLPGSPCSVSWRGDGEYFSVLTVDAELSIPQVRIYSKRLELFSVGRNIADGPASVLRGLGSAVAYATNGSLIALSLQQGRKQQVAFIEKNGLRHLEFDLNCPPVPEGCADWTVYSLHWDLPSTLLAVGLSRAGSNGTVGAVQIYCRGNYHWYLKQQWVAPGLRCLGFDAETVGRLFMVQCSAGRCLPEDSDDVRALSSLRIVDVSWDVCSSSTEDGSVAVVDGATVLLTPLAVNNVPPPLSMYKYQLPSPCRHSFFWPKMNARDGWGLACLCDDSTVRLVFAGSRGMPTGHIDIDVPAVLSSLSSSRNSRLFTLRGIAATEGKVGSTDEGERLIAIVLFGSRETEGVVLEALVDGEMGGIGEGGQPDEILTLTVRASDGAILSARHSRDIHSVEDDRFRHTSSVDMSHSARVGRIVLWPEDPSCLAVSLISGNDCFEVHRMETSCLLGDSSLTKGELLRSVRGLSVHLSGGSHLQGAPTSAPPEPCVQVAVIPGKPSSAATSYIDSSHIGDLVIGLTNRGKLYCGETLLVAGVSSFALNYPLQVLLYISTGTKPLLHFCSFAALRGGLGGSPTSGGHVRVGTQTCERGARLVLSAPGSPKVVLQMPRGNLEAFEPRPLIFLKARELIDSLQMRSCLLLLRRQKVDLNYLVDYNPVVFLSQVVPLVSECLATNPDLLSLLISSLEPGDTTAFKYPTPAPVGTPLNCTQWRNKQLPREDFYAGSLKVNTVCAALRDCLLGHLSCEGATQTAALNPALCTYAKPSPPLLVEALTLIKETSLRSESQKQKLSASKAPAAIKYLAFLVEGSALFEAALGCCDFDMARAVARQCQMDPKAYLPLLKGFEDMGVSLVEKPRNVLQGKGWEVAHMHFAVCVHLKRFEEAIEWTLALLEAAWSEGVAAEGEAGDSVKITFQQVIEETFRVVSGKETNYFAFALPRIVKCLNGITVGGMERARSEEGPSSDSSACVWIVSASRDFLSRLRVSYGDFCLKKLQYSEAVAAYLSAQPPRAADAIKAARLLGDWQLALMIAGRYGAGGGGCEEKEGHLDARRVAFEIVSAFRESLEQGESGIFDDQGDTDLAPLGFGAAEEGGGMEACRGKAIEAAQISVDYCGDSEAAVSILLLSAKWTAAVHMALRAGRKDLLTEEIAPAIRVAARSMISALPGRSARQAALVVELSALWAKPDARLAQVASTEPTLVAELNGGHINPDGTVWRDKEGDDTKSEFSVISRQSGASYVSSASRSSVRSSASSSVSILSNMSVGSTGGKSVASTSAFSIDGLDHSLLSRGTVKGPGGSDMGGKKEPERKYKRRQRKTGKGEGGRDLWGLRREAAVCAELWSLAQVSSIARNAKDLCDALSLFSLGDAGDVSLACSLQASVDLYVKELQSHSPPVAPMYPPQWMAMRLLGHVARFQEIIFPTVDLDDIPEKRNVSDDNGDDEDDGEISSELITLARQLHYKILQEKRVSSALDTWWKTAADGISIWQSFRRIVLES